MKTKQVTVSRTANALESNGYVWSVTFDTPTVVGGVTTAGDQPPFYANGRMLGNTTVDSSFRLEVGLYQYCDILTPFRNREP